MAPFPKLRWLIAMLCVAVIVLRVGGTHLHLCFDGDEPPVSLHIADSGIHHADEPAGDHSDREITPGADALVKKSSDAVDALTLALLGAVLLFVVACGRVPLPDFRSPLPAPSRSRLRPPLRGPPRHA
jgi:hypothetical protein